MLDIVALSHDERIGRRNGDIDGTLRFQRVANIVDDALTDEWAHSIVEDEIGRFGLIEAKGVNSRIGAFLPTCYHVAHLLVVGFSHYLLGFFQKIRIRYHANFIDMGIAFESLNGMSS